MSVPTAALRALVATALCGSVLWAGAARPPATFALALIGALALGFAIVDAARAGRSLGLAPLAVAPAVMTLLCLAQLVPLPAGLRGWLSPVEERTRELVLAGIQHGAWRPLTADVAATLADAVKMAGLAAIAIAAGRLGGDRHRRFLRGALLAGAGCTIAVAALSVAGVTLPEPLAAASGRSPVRFPFVNPNHAGALLVLTLPMALAQVARLRGRAAAAIGAGVLAGNLALAATGSRAAIALGLVAQAAVLGLILRARDDGSDRTGRLIGLAVGGLGLLFTVATPLLYVRLRAGSAPSPRWELLHAALPMLRDHLLTGVGRGAFPFVVARYSPLAAQLRFGFAENEYLQLLIDLGVAGAALTALLVVVAVARAVRAQDHFSLQSRAALIGLGALALHNLVDFSWEAGGVAVAACAAGALAFPVAPRALRIAPAALWAALTCALALLAASGVAPSADADARVLREPADRATFVRHAESALRRHPADGFLANLAAERLIADRDARAGVWLDRALLDGPHDTQAHRLTARALALAGFGDQAALEARVALADANQIDEEACYREIVTLFGGDSDGKRLVAAVPPNIRQLAEVMSRVAGLHRPDLVEALGGEALKIAPDDPTVLRLLVQPGMERGDRAVLAERALRLERVDPKAGLLAARALVQAGRAADADQLLGRVLERATGAEAVEAAVQLADGALARGDLEQAAGVLDTALARAVETRDKARLHLQRATVEDRAGRVHRAELERAEAARLSGR